MYYNHDTLLFLNGQFVEAKNASTSLYSQTLHYGNGVFEGIRAYNTKNGTRIFKAREHYERFRHSAQVMHIPFAFSLQELEDASYQLLEKNNQQDAYIRPLLFLGENMSLSPTQDVNLVIMTWAWGKYLGDKLVRIMISSFQRPNPKACFVEAKAVGHYTNSILASTEAKNKGFDEALLTDSQGNIAEGPGANFFYEKDGVLYTPPLGNILAGITRATVLEIAKQKNIKVVEKLFQPDDIFQADSAFFCGTAVEVIGIASIDHYTFPLPWEKSLGAIIQKAYHDMVLEEY